MTELNKMKTDLNEKLYPSAPKKVESYRVGNPNGGVVCDTLEEAHAVCDKLKIDYSLIFKVDLNDLEDKRKQIDELLDKIKKCKEEINCITSGHLVKARYIFT